MSDNYDDHNHSPPRSRNEHKSTHSHHNTHNGRGGGRGRRSAGGGGGRGGGGGGHQSRQVQISKALSRLLRHAAVEEKIPIDEHGYVRCDRLLEWRRLKSLSPRATLEEVVDEVRTSDKQRFGLMFVGSISREKDGVGRGGDDGGGGSGNVGVSEKEDDQETGAKRVEEEEQGKDGKGGSDQTLTQTALSIYDHHTQTNVPHDPKSYHIRATQGHSMNLVTTENLLTPITLDDEKCVPETVVHGTFYGAWERILKDGCLKRMGRNHVHFATGPRLGEVLTGGELPDRGGGGAGGQEKDREVLGMERVLERNKVISGMRRDAQVLIYIDVRKALSSSSTTINKLEAQPQPEIPPDNGQGRDDTEDDDAGKAGLQFYRSENNVILTPGLGPTGIVPSEYWDVVVEMKEGLGVLWRAGEGLVKELPDRLKGKSVPFGKDGRHGRNGRGRGGGGKSRGDERHG